MRDTELASSLMAGELGRGNRPPPPNLTLLENFFQKYNILDWEFPILGEFRDEVEILNLHIFSVLQK